MKKSFMIIFISLFYFFSLLFIHLFSKCVWKILLRTYDLKSNRLKFRSQHCPWLKMEPWVCDSGSCCLPVALGFPIGEHHICLPAASRLSLRAGASLPACTRQTRSWRMMPLKSTLSRPQAMILEVLDKYPSLLCLKRHNSQVGILYWHLEHQSFPSRFSSRCPQQ